MTQYDAIEELVKEGITKILDFSFLKEETTKQLCVLYALAQGQESAAEDLSYTLLEETFVDTLLGEKDLRYKTFMQGLATDVLEHSGYVHKSEHPLDFNLTHEGKNFLESHYGGQELYGVKIEKEQKEVGTVTNLSADNNHDCIDNDCLGADIDDDCQGPNTC